MMNGERLLILQGLESDDGFFRSFQVYNELRNYKKALAQFNKIVEEGRANDVTYYNMGNTFYRQRKYRIAIEKYKKAIELNNKNDKAYNDLGYIYYEKLKEYQNAVDSFKNATVVNPKHYKAFNNMGLAYQRLKDEDRAVEAFKKAVIANPEYNRAYINMFKSQLLNNKPFDKGVEEQYSKIFKNQKELFMVYEMFVVLKKISNGERGDLVTVWKRDYRGIGLKWGGMNELKYWAMESKNTKVKKSLLRAIQAFRRHTKS